MTLTLKRIASSNRTAEPCYLVLQTTGTWSVGAKIIAISANYQMAENIAMEQKHKTPQQHFGVFALRAEAREIADPIEIVRVVE